jgi:hypothetical protein
MDTGQKRCASLHGNWLGAIGYLALLDQIGSCFRLRGVNSCPDKAGVLKAMYYFSDLDERERKAIYALRCCFAHDYNLFNKPKRRKPDPMLVHRFLVGVGGALIEFPDIPWDGDWRNRTSGDQTKVSLEALGDLVEDIANRIRQHAQAQELALALDGGHEELEAKYSLYTHH